MFGLGAGEILVILVIALIFIGPKKLPELAKGLGRGIREFQKAKDEVMSEVNKTAAEAEITEVEAEVIHRTDNYHSDHDADKDKAQNNVDPEKIKKDHPS